MQIQLGSSIVCVGRSGRLYIERYHLQMTLNMCRIWASLVAQVMQNLPAKRVTRVQSWVRKIHWKREWLPTPIFLPEEFYVQRSLVGYSPWGCKELT